MKKRRYKFKYDEQEFEVVLGVYVERDKKKEEYKDWPFFWINRCLEYYYLSINYKLLEIVKPIKLKEDDFNSDIEIDFSSYTKIVSSEEEADEIQSELEKNITQNNIDLIPILIDTAEYIEENIDSLILKQSLEIEEE